eukprot:6748999-Pyramimonas_sp.AAC.1
MGQHARGRSRCTCYRRTGCPCAFAGRQLRLRPATADLLGERGRAAAPLNSQRQRAHSFRH